MPEISKNIFIQRITMEKIYFTELGLKLKTRNN